MPRHMLRISWLCLCFLLSSNAAVTDVFAPRIHSLEEDDWALLSPSMERLLSHASEGLRSSRFYRPSPRGALPEAAVVMRRGAEGWGSALFAKEPARLAMVVEGEGMHRTLQIQMQAKGVKEAVDVFLLMYLPRSCYVDTYELTNRHEYGVQAKATLLHTYRSSVDVESPALTSTSLAIGLEFRQVKPAQNGDLHLSMTLPIHIRYLRPTGVEDAQPEETKVTLQPPLVFARSHTSSELSSSKPSAHFEHVFHESHLGRPLSRTVEDASGYRYVNVQNDKDRVVLHYLRGDVRHKWLSLVGTFIVSVCSLGAIVKFMLR